MKLNRFCLIILDSLVTTLGDLISVRPFEHSCLEFMAQVSGLFQWYFHIPPWVHLKIGRELFQYVNEREKIYFRWQIDNSDFRWIFRSENSNILLNVQENRFPLVFEQ